MEDPSGAMPDLKRKVFSMQLSKTGPQGLFVSEPYDLFFASAGGNSHWSLRIRTNGGHNVLLTSAPMADAWLVDATMRARSDVVWRSVQKAPVNVRVVGHDPRNSVVDVETASSKPVLEQIFTLLKDQTAFQKAALDESKAIFQEGVREIQYKLGTVETRVQDLDRTRAETTTALLEQKDSIEQFQAQHETNSDEICQIKEDIFKLQQQLAKPGDAATHVHYHDNRCVIVIQEMPFDLTQLQEPIPLMWYNRHNTGKKWTKVYLGL